MLLPKKYSSLGEGGENLDVDVHKNNPQSPGRVVGPAERRGSCLVKVVRVKRQVSSAQVQYSALHSALELLHKMLYAEPVSGSKQYCIR